MEKLTAQLPPTPKNTITPIVNLDLEAELSKAVQKNTLALPERFRQKLLAGFRGFEDKITAAREAVLAGQSLFITGPCGTGKTHIAVGLAYEWYIQNIKMAPAYLGDGLEKQYPKAPKFLPSVEFFFELKSTFDSSVSESEVIDRYSGVPLLILDDLGTEKVSDWSRQVCYMLVDRRYRAMKQTIITSNLDLAGISKAIDDRISSRIIEMGAVVKLEGKDYRLNARA